MRNFREQSAVVYLAEILHNIIQNVSQNNKTILNRLHKIYSSRRNLNLTIDIRKYNANP